MRIASILIFLSLACGVAHAEDAERSALTARLALEVAGAVKAGDKPTAWITVLGTRGQYRIDGADEHAVSLIVEGNAFPVKWETLPPDELLNVAKAIAGNNGARLMLAGEIALSTGKGDQATDLFAKARQSDPALADKLNALSAKAPKAPAAGTDAPTTPATPDSPANAPPGPPNPPGGKMIDAAIEEDTTSPLHLPDAGLQTRMWSAAKDNYLPRANILYARFTWKDWGLDGRGKIEHYKAWMAKKRYVAFRMYCNDDKELPDPSLPFVTVDGKTIPKYWDPKFVEAHKRFIQAVGKEIANNPYLAYVDIGGVGNSGGEWLVYPDDRYEAKPMLAQYGYTAEVKEKLVWELMKAYREAFPNVRLYLAGAGYSCVKDRAALNAYMIKNNIGVRSDGLCWKTVGDGDEWSARKSGSDKIWRDVPFQWEGSYTTMEWEKDGWSTEKTMEKAMDFGPISFCYADADKDALRFEGDPAKVKILDTAALKLGYRIAITHAKYYDTLRSGGTLQVELKLTNRGASKIYADRDLELSFLGADGKPVASVKVKPTPGTRDWEPGKELTVTLAPVVKSVPLGSWQLAIGMLDEDPRRPDSRLEMAMKKKAAGNRYILGNITVR